MSQLTINGRVIAPGQPTYVVAEISANHNQAFEQAAAIIRVAKEARADAVKIQTYTPDTITIDCDNEHFQIGRGTIWQGQNLHSLYAKAYTPWDWQPKLKTIAEDLGLGFFSTPFDDTSVEFLERMGVSAYKVASFEIVDLPLIDRIARTGKPLIISTGMASIEEIEEALSVARAAGAKEIALLKCTSAYPAAPEEANLRTIRDMEQRFETPVGLSDHTLGDAVPIASVALGACIVEKHLTLSRSTPSPDSAFSLEPDEFRRMVENIRIAEKSMGDVKYGPSKSELSSYVFRRSLFVVQPMKTGDVFTRETVRSIRPGYGLAPKCITAILGKRATQDIPRGTPLRWEFVEDMAIRK